MKKIVFFFVTCCAIAATAYAGVAYIDYSTGNFKCTNGFEGNLPMCTGSNLETFGYENCQNEVAKICN